MNYLTALKILLVVIILGYIYLKVKQKGYFWKDKKGNELTFKQFLKRWKDGYSNVTPVQQTRITLWSFLPIFAGIVWGLFVTFLGGTYWLGLILLGSLPLTSMQFISNLQKFKSQRKVEEVMNKLNESRRSSKSIKKRKK